MLGSVCQNPNSVHINFKGDSFGPFLTCTSQVVIGNTLKHPLEYRGKKTFSPALRILDSESCNSPVQLDTSRASRYFSLGSAQGTGGPPGLQIQWFRLKPGTVGSIPMHFRHPEKKPRLIRGFFQGGVQSVKFREKPVISDR